MSGPESLNAEMLETLMDESISKDPMDRARAVSALYTELDSQGKGDFGHVLRRWLRDRNLVGHAAFIIGDANICDMQEDLLSVLVFEGHLFGQAVLSLEKVGYVIRSYDDMVAFLKRAQAVTAREKRDLIELISDLKIAPTLTRTQQLDATKQAWGIAVRPRRWLRLPF